VFSFFSNKAKYVLNLNDGLHRVNLEGKETILSAALRAGIPMANSCRVGGCATCKCKLISGKVKQLTESSYVLSEDELDQGYILACQSVAKSDVAIEAILNEAATQFTSKKFAGIITAQDKLTHDITHVKISLNEAINYAAGQYAEISIPGLSPAIRAYSFASPAKGQEVAFFIREVAGGELSPLIHSRNLLGTSVELDGPIGHFYLREADAPIVCIAGGSGLAPIKALLQQALKDGVKRDVVFYFGARSQQDLYCSDEIFALTSQWQGTFTYVPVLSEEPQDSNWQGRRGMVTDALSESLSGQEHAYLCGPPLMIDAAIEVLTKHGVSSSHIHFDKFISKADLAAA
jgi:NAD(P)H-flavin reductase/ferredoxin